jgi:hypothetical protein
MLSNHFRNKNQTTYHRHIPRQVHVRLAKATHFSQHLLLCHLEKTFENPVINSMNEFLLSLIEVNLNVESF